MRNNYAKLQNKVFTPTELGTLVSKITEQYFPDIINTKFTANLESQLDDIAEGKVSWEKTIYNFYSNFRKDVEKAETEMEKYRPDCKYPSCDGQKQAFGICTVQVCSFGKSLVE